MKDHEVLLARDLLDEIFIINPEEGTIIQKKQTSSRVAVGGIPGKINHNGYRVISINYHKYFAHRLMWFYAYGEWPADEIDHINHRPLDNRIANLRCTTQAENSRNSSLSKRNKTGHTGVSWHKRGKKWQAYVTFKGVRHYLGLFDDKQEAIKARQKKNEEYNFHPNHGVA